MKSPISVPLFVGNTNPHSMKGSLSPLESFCTQNGISITLEVFAETRIHTDNIYALHAGDAPQQGNHVVYVSLFHDLLLRSSTVYTVE